MKLGDVMSAMHFNLFAQIALIIAVRVRGGLASTFLARNREPFRRRKPDAARRRHARRDLREAAA
jgi:hypothetical protein